jgi:hypothetical protein
MHGISASFFVSAILSATIHTPWALFISGCGHSLCKMAWKLALTHAYVNKKKNAIDMQIR